MGQLGPVQCFSSAPKELRLRPAAPFALAPGALNEVDLTLRPSHAGRKQYVVHAVDLQRGALLSSWLVCAVNRLPAVTKAFSLSVTALQPATLHPPRTHARTHNTRVRCYLDMTPGLPGAARLRRAQEGLARQPIHVRHTLRTEHRPTRPPLLQATDGARPLTFTLTREPEPEPNPNLNPTLTPTLTPNPHSKPEL